MTGITFNSLVQRINNVGFPLQALQVNPINKAHGAAYVQCVIVLSGSGKNIFKVKRQKRIGPADVNDTNQNGVTFKKNNVASLASRGLTANAARITQNSSHSPAPATLAAASREGGKDSWRRWGIGFGVASACLAAGGCLGAVFGVLLGRCRVETPWTS